MFNFLVAASKSNLPHVTEGTEMPNRSSEIKEAAPKSRHAGEQTTRQNNALHEIREWWHEQLAYRSSDEEEDEL